MPESLASSTGSASDRIPGAIRSDAAAAPERADRPLEPLRRRLRERSALEEMGPLFAGPAAPPHGEHHSPYR